MSSRKKFLDSIRLFTKGGTGGSGYPPKMAKGGDGGSVSFVAKNNATLASVLKLYPSKRIIALPGRPAGKKVILGTKGTDIRVSVPTGVEMRLDNGEVIANLDNEGEVAIAAEGGKGGGPLNGYSATRGINRSVILDLKLIADLGLVGFPNAGKSTLLKSVSRSNPKIAEYPFTTLRPLVATLSYKDGRQITMADLPGLIEGAHVNVGLGHHFLKHIERTKCLLFVVDVTGFQFKQNLPHRSVEETALLLNRELELYKSHLLDKPALCVVNKSDLVRDEPDLLRRAIDNLRDLRHFVSNCDEPIDPLILPSNIINFKEVIDISAKYEENTDCLKSRIRHWLDEFEVERKKEDTESMEQSLKDELHLSNKENFKSMI